MKCLQKFASGLHIFFSMALPFTLFFLCASLNACTFASDGWHSRMETMAGETLKTARHNQENTRALVLATEKKEIIANWEKRKEKIPEPSPVPEDKDGTTLIETLLYILLSMSGLGAVGKGAHALYKYKAPGGQA